MLLFYQGVVINVISSRNRLFFLLLLSLISFFPSLAMCSSHELGAELELLSLSHVLFNCANCFLFQGLVNAEMEKIRTADCCFF